MMHRYRTPLQIAAAIAGLVFTASAQGAPSVDPKTAPASAVDFTVAGADDAVTGGDPEVAAATGVAGGVGIASDFAGVLGLIGICLGHGRLSA